MLICIDAGHGRNTAGKRCLKRIDPGETREWTLNSRIADKLQALLAGYNCQTMRADDVTGERDVPLADRCEAANTVRADVYVSITPMRGVVQSYDIPVISGIPLLTGMGKDACIDEIIKALK